MKLGLCSGHVKCFRVPRFCLFVWRPGYVPPIVVDQAPPFSYLRWCCFTSLRLQEAERDSLLILKGAEVEKEALLKASKTGSTAEAQTGAAAAEPKAEPAEPQSAASKPAVS